MWLAEAEDKEVCVYDDGNELKDVDMKLCLSCGMKERTVESPREVKVKGASPHAF